eukprot:8158936-Alexandrium_andersonii.AAC.1
MGPVGSLPGARSHGGGHSWGPPVVLAPRPPDHPPPPHVWEDPGRATDPRGRAESAPAVAPGTAAR